MHMQPKTVHKLLLLLTLLLLSACGSASEANVPTPASSPTLVPVVAASELVVGRNRLPIGVIKNGTPVNDPQLKVQLGFYYLGAGETSTVQSQSEAVYRGEGLPAGLYVAYPTLNKAGPWNMEVRIDGSDGVSQVNRMRVDVVAQPSTPAVGSAAISSKNLTVRDVPELKQLTSDNAPDPDLYQLTIADALAVHKPFLVAFATPGFCQSATCAPNIRVVKQLKNEFKSQINFIHVEVYPYPFGDAVQQNRFVPAMGEWKLKTEPWTFLVDSKGIIQAKYEGGITLAELEPALKQLAGGEAVQP